MQSPASRLTRKIIFKLVVIFLTLISLNRFLDFILFFLYSDLKVSARTYRRCGLFLIKRASAQELSALLSLYKFRFDTINYLSFSVYFLKDIISRQKYENCCAANVRESLNAYDEGWKYD